MAWNGNHWKWTKPRTRAAQLAAEDQLTNEEIADTVGVSRQAVDNWRTAPQFQARITEIVAATAQALQDQGIANVKNRVAAQDDRWRRMQRLLDARAADPTMADVPGGDTGLLVRQAKLIKVYAVQPTPEQLADLETPPEQLTSARREVLVYEYAADTALAAQMLATEKEASQQLGQRVEKQEVTGADGGPLEFTDVREQITRKLARLADAQAARGTARGAD